MDEDMRVVKRPTNNLDTAYVEKLAQDFKAAKEALATFEKRTNDLKKELSSIVESNGLEDDKGNLWLEVGDLKLKRERRLQVTFDSQRAEEWAKENGYWDEIKEVIEVVSEDKVLGLAWQDETLSRTIQSFYNEKETWAFKA